MIFLDEVLSFSLGMVIYIYYFRFCLQKEASEMTPMDVARFIFLVIILMVLGIVVGIR